ncbi:unnamed protein product [Lathyrus oleraceus]
MIKASEIECVHHFNTLVRTQLKKREKTTESGKSIELTESAQVEAVDAVDEFVTVMAGERSCYGCGGSRRDEGRGAAMVMEVL